jgi:hypothetical protein
MMNAPKITATYKWKGGKLLSKRYDYPSGSWALYEWDYDGKGNVLAMYEQHDALPRQKLTEYHYDQAGKNIETTAGSAVCKNVYDASGLLVKSTATYPEAYGSKVEESSYTWNKDGTLNYFKFTRKHIVSDKSNTQLQGAVSNDDKVLEYFFRYEYYK